MGSSRRAGLFPHRAIDDVLDHVAIPFTLRVALDHHDHVHVFLRIDPADRAARPSPLSSRTLENNCIEVQALCKAEPKRGACLRDSLQSLAMKIGALRREA